MMPDASNGRDQSRDARIDSVEAKAIHDAELFLRDGPDMVLLANLRHLDKETEPLPLRWVASQINALLLYGEVVRRAEEDCSEEESLRREAAFVHGFQLGYDYYARYGPLPELGS